MKPEVTAGRKQDKSDIRTESVFVRFILGLCPVRWREDVLSYIILSRFDRPIGWWLLLLPGLWSIWLAYFETAKDVQFDMALLGRCLWLSALFFIGSVVMRSAGCVINDIWDRDLDKKVERTRLRPVASGALSLRQALIFLGLLLVLGLLILLQMNGVTIVLGFLSLPLVIVYPLMKRFTWWPQAFLGLTFNFGALMGWSAVVGGMPEAVTVLAFLPAVFLYIAGIFWTLGYDTIYAHQDIEDDIMVGIKSTALKFGAMSKVWVSGFYALSVFGIGLAVFFVFNHILASAIVVLFFATHLGYQLLAWRQYDAPSALKMFKANRVCGGLVLLGIVLAGGVNHLLGF